MTNAGVHRLLDLLGLVMPAGQANLLDWLLGQGGLRSCLLNEAEVCGDVLQGWPTPAAQAPLLLTRLRSVAGELRLFSMFTSFGSPLDVTLASLRIKDLFTADAATAAALSVR